MIWTLRNKVQWNFYRNLNIFNDEIAFESVVWQSVSHLVSASLWFSDASCSSYYLNQCRLQLIGPIWCNLNVTRIEIQMFFIKKIVKWCQQKLTILFSGHFFHHNIMVWVHSHSHIANNLIHVAHVKAQRRAFGSHARSGVYVTMWWLSKSMAQCKTAVTPVELLQSCTKQSKMIRTSRWLVQDCYLHY